MDFWQDVNWFAVQTKPSGEEVATSYLSRLGLEVFLPKIRRQTALWGTRHSVVKPLFSGYLFVRFSPAFYLHLVRYARGVQRVVSAGDIPLPVDEEVIQLIRERVSSSGIVERDPEEIRAGQKVVVQGGPLKGLLGVFEREIGDRERVVLLLDAIHYQARVLIDKRDLYAVTQAV